MQISHRSTGVAIVGILIGGLLLAHRSLDIRQGKVPANGAILSGNVVEALAGLPPDSSARPYLLFYGNADCTHCQAELARWTSAGGEFPGLLGRVRVVLVARNRVDVLVTKAGQLAVDTLGDAGGGLMEALGVRAYPTMLFVSHDYRVRGRHVGEMSPEAMRAELEAILRAGA